MIVYCTSPWVPAEWIRAHGLEAKWIWQSDRFYTREPLLEAGDCPIARSIYDFAEQNPDSPVVFATSCDLLRRGFDALACAKVERVFLFNIPSTLTTAGREMLRSEVQRLGRFLCENGGVAPGQGVLAHEMKRANYDRNRQRDSLHLSHSLQGRIPLALVGGPFLKSHRELLDVIEASGGQVVVDGTETGERALEVDFDLAACSDAFETLVSGYFDHITDVFQRPNQRLYSWLKTRIESRSVRGILLWHYTGCDLWRAEMQSLRETLGLPVLSVEAGRMQGLAPREITRIEAFMETLK